MKVLFSLACAGAIAAAAPAWAADLLGTSPPLSMPANAGPLLYEVGSGWYVRGDLGVSFDDGPSLTLPALSAPPPGLTAPRLFRADHALDRLHRRGRRGLSLQQLPAFRRDLGLPHRARRIEPVDGRVPVWADRIDQPGSAQPAPRLSLQHLQHLHRPDEPQAAQQHVPRQRLCRPRNLLRLHALYRRRARLQHQHHVGKPRLRDRQRPALRRRPHPDRRLSADLARPVRQCDRPAAQHRLRAAELESLVQFDDLHLRLGALRRARVSAHSEHDARRRLSIFEQRRDQHPHQSANRHEVQGKQLVATDPGGHSLHPAVERGWPARDRSSPRRWRFTPAGPCVTVGCKTDGRKAAR